MLKAFRGEDVDSMYFVQPVVYVWEGGSYFFHKGQI